MENTNKEKKENKKFEEKKIGTNKEEEKETIVETKEKTIERKTEAGDKKETKKKDIKLKKNFSIVNGKDLKISKKHAMAICDMIRHKKVQDAIDEIEQILKMKKPLKMKGEIPHRKGKGIMSGRYPLNACRELLKLVKSLASNASVNGMEADKTKIIIAIANQASRPYKRFGSARFKRTNVFIKAKEIRESNK
jgi:ribosomal protein L22